MRSSPIGRLMRSNSVRMPALALATACALNMSGCQGSRRNAMRPKFFGSTRSEAVIVNQGYTAVESPGAIVQQQQGATVIQQQQGVQQNVVSEPPITLEPRTGGTTTSIVPSFGDAQQSVGSPSSNSSVLTPRTGDSPRSVIDSLAPPAEAPQAIMEAPPISNLDKPASSSIESSVKRTDPAPGEEPRLEVIPPGSTPGAGGPSTPSGSGSGGKEPAASKTSAWRTQQPAGGSGRTTYQASARKSVGSGSPGDPLGVID